MTHRVRAIIINENKILLIHRIKVDQEYWVFPGGGVEEYDLSQEEGLRRECLEELGVHVEVKDLIMEKPSLAPNAIGQMEYFYICNIIGGKVGTGKGPEFHRDAKKFGSYHVEWISLSVIKEMNIFPLELRDKIVKEHIN